MMMLDKLTTAALAAGREIMDVLRSGIHVAYKDDSSPVTDAERRAETLILTILAENLPHIPVIAEESAANGVDVPAGGKFFLVDPLDGTREFIAGHRDFTVNIALIGNGAPLLGVVYAPALQQAWRGGHGGAEKLQISDDFAVAARHPINCRARPVAPAAATALVSRSHLTPRTQNFVAEHGLSDCLSIGSSLKFCLLSEGLADVYPRFGRTMMWDTAAGDTVLRAAGGMTLDMAGLPLRYDIGAKRDTDPDFLANPDFIAWGVAPR